MHRRGASGAPHAVDTVIRAVLARQAGQWRIQAPEKVTLTKAPGVTQGRLPVFGSGPHPREEHTLDTLRNPLDLKVLHVGGQAIKDNLFLQ